MTKSIATATSVAALALGLGGCGGGTVHLSPQPVVSGSPTSQYVQIERLSRPAVKEVFEPFQDHQISNAAEPYNDPTISADIKATEDAVRPPTATTDYGTVLQSILYPDEYAVNVNGTSVPINTAGSGNFLGFETTKGADFGGRSPSDDVIALELSALFGNTLSTLGLVADDGEENNCISKQNVVIAASQQPNSTFPYFAAPH
jgi:hypothetical protein